MAEASKDDEAEATDPRPWFCIDCSDRFGREQVSGRHRTEYRPRPVASIRKRKKS